VSPISRRGPAKPDRPTPLGKALDDYLSGAGLKKRLQQAAILEEWATLVGPQIAAVTAPQFITADGLMRVHVASAPWAIELGLMTPRILARLNQGRSGRVKEIRWVPGPLDRPRP
jgi:predicted nucleic acid-binding Zn ribbon protein